MVSCVKSLLKKKSDVSSESADVAEDLWNKWRTQYAQEQEDIEKKVAANREARLVTGHKWLYEQLVNDNAIYLHHVTVGFVNGAREICYIETESLHCLNELIESDSKESFRCSAWSYGYDHSSIIRLRSEFLSFVYEHRDAHYFFIDKTIHSMKKSDWDRLCDLAGVESPA